ncbi:hypothetical protein SAMN04489761_4261 [Tenacibaculum sp. MAR_2009_124]|uniref:hypothetical protein n=1 Tax=Tenacibaculum sp. MAR_2009_124 TaxID=1250059 RepID=UPI00089DA5EE|nr:hypothetical protein [Tenacibaculum sp. MAR_2009_124]SED09660.1 hypothetical protein SAMN04489761_4261 [Tenacibaculum sp. MAR_2009_124]
MSKNKKKEQGYFDTSFGLSLEDRMTSLRAVSVAVIFYIIGYSAKLTVLFSDALNAKIPNDYIRIPTSLFTALALSVGLLIVSVNENNKKTPYLIALMDAIALFLLFDVLNSKGTDIITTSFLSVFMAFVGFNLINTFVTKRKQEFEEVKQTLNKLEQEANNRKQDLSNIEKNLIAAKQLLNKVKHEKAETEQEKAAMEQEMKERTCPHCETTFPSKKALNPHIDKCKMNPKNIKE